MVSSIQTYEVTSPGHLEVQTRSTPALGPKDLLIKVKRTGICATDLHILDGDLGVGYPVTPGHEFVGQVAEAGSEAQAHHHVALGDHVAVEMSVPCNQCQACKEGRYNLCAQDDRSVSPVGRQYGINIPSTHEPHLWGGFAQYLYVPEDGLVHRLPDSLPWDIAALTEPTAVAFRAVDRAEVKRGDTVAVIGPGPIGVLTAVAAKQRGAQTVVVVGTRDSRLEIAQRFGADQTVNLRDVDLETEIRRIFPSGADVVIETAGQASAQEMSVKLVRRGGIVVLAGACGWDVPITFHQDQDLLLNEIDVRGSFLSAGGFELAIDTLAHQDFPFEELITHKYTFDELSRAFVEARDRSYGVFKAIVEIN